MSEQKILALSMRPRTLSALYGQEALIKQIRNHMEKRPPQTWLFQGASGTGKTTVMRIMSTAFQCDHMKLWGDPCKECWERRDGFGIHELNASDNTGVEDMRHLVELSRFRPINCKKRVIILDEAHKLSNAAVNMLLKPLEEPSASTIWLLGTSETIKLAALKRRPVSYRLKSLSIDDTEKFLKHFATKAGIERALDPLYEVCHLAGVSSPGFLLQALEKYDAGATATDAVAGADSNVDTLRLCRAVTQGDWKTIATQLKSASADDVRWIRASVAGWLKAILAKDSSLSVQEKAASSITELCAIPYDEQMVLPWLWSTLHKISRRYRQ